MVRGSRATARHRHARQFREAEDGAPGTRVGAPKPRPQAMPGTVFRGPARPFVQAGPNGRARPKHRRGLAGRHAGLLGSPRRPSGGRTSCGPAAKRGGNARPGPPCATGRGHGAEDTAATRAGAGAPGGRALGGPATEGTGATPVLRHVPAAGPGPRGDGPPANGRWSVRQTLRPPGRRHSASGLPAEVSSVRSADHSSHGSLPGRRGRGVPDDVRRGKRRGQSVRMWRSALRVGPAGDPNLMRSQSDRRRSAARRSAARAHGADASRRLAQPAHGRAPPAHRPFCHSHPRRLTMSEPCDPRRGERWRPRRGPRTPTP